MALAVAALIDREVSRIILTRPAVEAGERLGFLPGDLMAKVDPYLRPLFDALLDMLDSDRVQQYLEKGIVEVAPLAFMRGRTLNDSFIILDEAQNTTPEQMQMFLTRLGFGSKVVVTGDVTQIDLPRGQGSGLIEVREILQDIPDISFVLFDRQDVVRHKLVQRIVDAYRIDAERRGDHPLEAWRSRSTTARPSAPTRRPWRRGSTRCSTSRARATAEVALILVGPAEMQGLNREYRGPRRGHRRAGVPDRRARRAAGGHAAAARRRRDLPRALRRAGRRAGTSARRRAGGAGGARHAAPARATTTSTTTARCCALQDELTDRLGGVAWPR